jgi:hypothetical protein
VARGRAVGARIITRADNAWTGWSDRCARRGQAPSPRRQPDRRSGWAERVVTTTTSDTTRKSSRGRAGSYSAFGYGDDEGRFMTMNLSSAAPKIRGDAAELPLHERSRYRGGGGPCPPSLPGPNWRAGLPGANCVRRVRLPLQRRRVDLAPRRRRPGVAVRSPP